MPEYRAYTVDDDGHFSGFEVFTSSDDTGATERAKRLVDGQDVELWNGARLVVILKHQRQLSDEVKALNRQIDQSQRMSKDAKGEAATARMDRPTDDLTQERDDQQKCDDEN